MILPLISNLLTKITPKYLHLPLEYKTLKLSRSLEREMYHLNTLITKKGRAIDIGANRGLYSYALAKICESVEAFEPQPWCCEVIEEYSRKFNKHINVHNCGLSDSDSILQLNIPILKGRIQTTLATGVASVNAPQGEYKSIDIDVYPLDKFDFQDVVFMKIDVEGHESKVLEGAKKTILREKPIILVEIEQRHLGETQIQLIFQQINSLGYDGFFLTQDGLQNCKYFDVDRHQDIFKLADPIKTSKYVSNFIFKPVTNRDD
jgi:FkbM family methyltransferase